MANRWLTQFVGSLHKKPAIIDCNFTVDSTNGNGFGARSLKGAGVGAVYMHTTASFTGNTHTSTTIDGISGGTSSFQIGAQLSGSGLATGTLIATIPSSTSITINFPTTTTVSGDTISYVAPGSPNPASGLIYVNFQDNWNYYYWGTAGFVSPLSGTPISISTGSSLTVGSAYTIVSIGTTTTAQWVAVGLPIGTVPVIGATFIASATSGAGTGVVETSTSSGIDHIEVLGDPNTTITSNAATIFGTSSGSYMILQCLNGSGALTAPANGTVIGLSFFFSNSSIQVKGD